MTERTIWRYLSLAKYVELLSSQSLFFPKASLFADSTEGKWVAHALRYDISQRMDALESDMLRLEKLLATVGNDQSAVLREADVLLASGGGHSSSFFREVLGMAMAAPRNKRVEVLTSMHSGWRETNDKRLLELEALVAESRIRRECTYISCWNRSASMSLAMWTLYGGGPEGIAIRSTKRKLRKLIERNSSLLEEKGLGAGITDVQYVEGLQVPTEDALQKVFNILTGGEVSVSIFGLKPSLYEYEQEVRAIIFPKRSVFEPIRNPYPELAGFSLPIAERAEEGASAVVALVDAVYIHPTLGPGSMMCRLVSELNRRFNVAEMSIVADPVEPRGM